MDIRYFESLISVAELGSIARAARVHQITPAAVGQRIATLEKHFNTPLLDRASRKATPTEACIKLLPHARQIVSDFHDMSVKLTPSDLAGKFKLGAVSTALTGILPATIRQLAKIAPKVILQVQPGTSNSLFQKLSEHKVDAAIIALPPYELPRRYTVELLRDEPLLLISKNANGNTIREKLEKNPYICYDSKSWGGIKAARYLKDEKIPIEPIYELDALEAIEELVMQGMGVSLVPAWLGLEHRKNKFETEVIETDRYRRKLALVTFKENTRSQVIQRLIDALKESLKSHE